MLTRLEVDGFKTLQRVELPMSGFMVIAGVNAAGKSNLFDALDLLRRLCSEDLRESFQTSRGEGAELFARLGPDVQAREIRLAAEMILPRKVRDAWGDEAELTNTWLRYEVHIRRGVDARGFETLTIGRESLRALGKDDVTKRLGAFGEGFKRASVVYAGHRKNAYIEMSGDTIELSQDGKAGRKRQYKATDLQSTVLSGMNSAVFRHAFAARQELAAITPLHFDPKVLREANPFLAPTQMEADGRYLASMIAYRTASDPVYLKDIEAYVRQVVSELRSLEIHKDPVHERHVIQAVMSDGRLYPSKVLSDGTMRLIALAALRASGEPGSVLCLEEPENGIHPGRIKNLVKLLRALGADVFSSEPEPSPDPFSPLRQLLVNSHSPVLVGEVNPREMVLARLTRVTTHEGTSMVTRLLRVTEDDDSPTTASRQTVLDFLGAVEDSAWR